MEELIQRAKTYGYEGIEIEGKRPHGCPLDWPKSRCLDFRKRVADSGLVITGVAADNDFSSPISEHRESQLANVRELIRMTSNLDAKILRVFLAWTGATPLPDGGGRYDIAQKIWSFTHEHFSEEQTWAWCREGLVEAARIAGDHGVTLALQNHKPIITNYQQVLRMVREVASPHLKICLDAPLMEKKDPPTSSRPCMTSVLCRCSPILEVNLRGRAQRSRFFSWPCKDSGADRTCTRVT